MVSSGKQSLVALTDMPVKDKRGAGSEIQPRHVSCPFGYQGAQSGVIFLSLFSSVAKLRSLFSYFYATPSHYPHPRSDEILIPQIHCMVYLFRYSLYTLNIKRVRFFHSPKNQFFVPLGRSHPVENTWPRGTNTLNGVSKHRVGGWPSVNRLGGVNGLQG